MTDPIDKIRAEITRPLRVLPYDTTRCYPKYLCDRKHDCARFTSAWRPEGWQRVADYSALVAPGRECAAFVSNHREAK